MIHALPRPSFWCDDLGVTVAEGKEEALVEHVDGFCMDARGHSEQACHSLSTPIWRVFAPGVGIAGCGIDGLGIVQLPVAIGGRVVSDVGSESIEPDELADLKR